MAKQFNANMIDPHRPFIEEFIFTFLFSAVRTPSFPKPPRTSESTVRWTPLRLSPARSRLDGVIPETNKHMSSDRLMSTCYSAMRIACGLAPEERQRES